jgi:hypothetical protein
LLFPLKIFVASCSLNRGKIFTEEQAMQTVKTKFGRLRFHWIATGLLSLILLSAYGLSQVRAQEGKPRITILGRLSSGKSVQEPAPPPPEEKVDPSWKPVRVVVELISKKAGILALADSTVAEERVPPPPENATITPDNIDAYLGAVVDALPEGATWAKLYLPPPPPGKKWTGDDVATYAMGQTRLYGNVGGGEDNSVEILSQKLTPAQAQPIIRGLDLRPVYLITRRGQGTFQGRWTTTYGEMRLTQRNNRITGNYSTNGGRIEGRLIRGVLELNWYEDGNGTWGSGRFTLAEDGDSFSGIWRNSTDEQPGFSHNWTGKRISYRP